MRSVTQVLFLLSLVFFLILPLDALSQDLDDVTISGKITDSNGLPVFKATISAILSDTKTERILTTSEDGNYKFIELKPGTYSVKAEMRSFASQNKTDLVTVAGQNVRLDFKLSPADVTAEQTVTIEGENEPVIDATRTIVGGTITSREIEELPINSRNPLEFVLTLGGTTEEAFSTRNLSEDRNVTNQTPPPEQGNFSLSGGVSYSNNITIDGLDNNDDRSANVRFEPSLETIEEVQVITNQFSAEYGRASGGRVNLRTRSGTNRFRGRIFMFFRDDNLNANTFFNNRRKYSPVFPAVLPDTNPLYNRLPFTEYNPGFTLSGPVFMPKIYNGKNKTFFSVGYEYLNLRDTTFINTYVPLISNPLYPLPQPNENCPVANCIDATSSPAVAIAPYTALYPTPNLNNIFTAKLDQIINDKNNFTIGYQLGRRKNRRTTSPSVTRLDDALQARTTDSDAVNFTDNHVFGSRLVNQFRFQYSIFEPSFQTDTPDAPVVLIGYRNPETGGSQTLIAGNSTASGGNNETFPQNRRETRFQYQDSMTFVLGRNTLKFGADIQTIHSKAKELTDATGTFSFANVGAFQQNVLSRFRLNFGTGSDVKNNYWSGFINDESKIKQNLTLNFGVRYERETSVADTNNLGPRIGIAWSPFENAKGVIRFGGGIFYNRTLLRTIADFIQNSNGVIPFDTNTIGTNAADTRRTAILAAIARQFPNSFATESGLRTLVSNACATVTTTFPCSSSTGFFANPGDEGNPLRSVDPRLKIPESYQFNVGFEREIFKGWVFEANYTVNKTVRLWRDRNINAPVLPTGYADWTEYLINNPFQLSPTRRYTFYLGATGDSVGLLNPLNNQNCTTTTPNCLVNLNTTSTSTATPLVAVAGSNNNATGAPIGIALAAIARFRPDQNFEEKSRIGSIGKAFYQGLILEIRSRYKKFGGGFGGNFRFNYTLSSTRDDGLNNTSNAQINGDFESEFVRTNQDRRHRVAFSGSFDTPFWLGKLKFSPLSRAGTSAPYNIGIGGSDRNLDDVGTDRPNFTGNVSDINWREPDSAFPQSLFDRFSLAPIGSKGGNLPRNAGNGPAFFLFDLNVSREFGFGEKIKLRPNIQIDNILNATVFDFGAAFIDYTATNFLVPGRTFRQRQMRIGVRVDF